MNFKYRKQEGCPLECESCGSIAPLAKVGRLPMPNKDESRDICEVCYNTEIGSATDYRLSGVDVQLYRALAQCMNLVLDKVTGRKP